MKHLPLLCLLTLLAGCADTNYPPEGNVSAENYHMVSGVMARRSAAMETAMLVTSATVAAAGGGTAVPGNPNMRNYTVLVPNTSYKLPEGCVLLDGSK